MSTEVKLILGSSEFPIAMETLSLTSSLLFDHPEVRTTRKYEVQSAVSSQSFQEFLGAIRGDCDLHPTPDNVAELLQLSDEFGTGKLARRIQAVVMGPPLNPRLDVRFEQREPDLRSEISSLRQGLNALKTVVNDLTIEIRQNAAVVKAELERARDAAAAEVQTVQRRFENLPGFVFTPGDIAVIRGEVEVQPGERFRVVVEWRDGRESAFYVTPENRVAVLKRSIEIVLGVPFDQQRLSLAGSELENGRTLRDCGVQPDCTINVTQALRG
jgi:hypothetical protein